VLGVYSTAAVACRAGGEPVRDGWDDIENGRHAGAPRPYDVTEMLYAKERLSSIPDDSLTAFDKGFLSAEIFCGLASAGTNRQSIIPA
jgi:hypothetical protein